MTNAAPVSVQPPSVSAEAQEKYSKALTLISQGKTPEAKILLIEILEQEKMPVAFNELGKIFFTEGDSDSALGCYEEAIWPATVLLASGVQSVVVAWAGVTVEVVGWLDK